VYPNYHDVVWTPIANPSGPKTQSFSFGSTLNQEQLKKLLTPKQSKKWAGSGTELSLSSPWEYVLIN
jgi:hypothetical protein